MKKLYSIVAVAAMAITAQAQTTVNFVAANQGWADAQVLSGTYPIDANLDLTTSKGGSSTTPTYYTNGSAMRIYTNGAYFTITPKKGAVISSIVINAVAKYAPGVTYSVNGGAATSASTTNNVYTLSNLNASGPVKITNVDTTTQFRVGSFSVTYTTSSLGTVDFANAKNAFVKNTLVSNEVAFGTKVNDIKVISMNSQVIKTASVSENNNLNVAELNPGIYIVTGTVNGEYVSQKIIKK